MSRTPTSNDVLRNIELELAQSTVGSGDLSTAVQAVRRYQNTARARAVGDRNVDGATTRMISELFQINDMLLTLLDESSASIQALRTDLRCALQLPNVPAAGQPGAAVGGAGAVPVSAAGGSCGLPSKCRQDLEQAMSAQTLELTLHVRSSNLPLVGWLVNRLRVFLHVRGLHYARELASRQAPVNRALGESLIALAQAITVLRSELQALSERRSALEEDLWDAAAGSEAKPGGSGPGSSAA